MLLYEFLANLFYMCVFESVVVGEHSITVCYRSRQPVLVLLYSGLITWHIRTYCFTFQNCFAVAMNVVYFLVCFCN